MRFESQMRATRVGIGTYTSGFCTEWTADDLHLQSLVYPDRLVGFFSPQNTLKRKSLHAAHE